MCKGAEKEEMIPCFQIPISTHYARIVIHEEILSLQHCSGVESIVQEKPEKHFMLLLAAALPNPLEG
jgi:hypothetical protein